MSQTRLNNEKNERLLYHEIANASICNPAAFVNNVLSILLDFFPIKAAAFYTSNHQKRKLILRGQVNLDYSMYQSFELPYETFAGTSVSKRKTIIIQDITNSNMYRDKKLIEKFNLKSLVVFPLIFDAIKEGDIQGPIGAICVYPNNHDLELLSSRLDELGPFIASLYIDSIEQRKMNLRKKFVESAGYSHDMSGLLDRIVRIYQREFCVDGASLFLNDDRNNFLRLGASTGIIDEIEQSKFYYMPGSKEATYISVEKNQLFVYDDDDDIMGVVKPKEKLVDEPHNCILCPIEEAAIHPSQRKGKRVFGVLRALNRRQTHGDITHIISFGWEEVLLTKFFCEMVAVLVHFMKKGLNAENDFNKLMHGAKNNLQSALFNLGLLVDHGNISVGNSRMKYYLSDAIAYLSDLWSQIYRLELMHQEEPKLKKVALYGEVLSKIPSMIKSVSKRTNVGIFDITNLSEAGFDQVPFVLANKNALLTVFRNLTENAIKYCKPQSHKHKIEFSYEVVRGSVLIYVSDYGVGIPIEYEDLIFIEGFRTEDAMARHPSSIGMGLSDAFELMKRMNGAIRFVPSDEKTTFELSIPLFNG